jgi:hypothetical protein
MKINIITKDNAQLHCLSNLSNAASIGIYVLFINYFMN